MSDGESAIEFEGVTKRYGSDVAVDRIDLGVDPGTVEILIGPSGCGKSTTLRLAMGLVDPDSGTIRIQGTSHAEGEVRRRRRRMGYVIQEGGLFPHMTARENAALPARHAGWSDERVAGRLSELSDIAQFPDDQFDQYPDELSGGQRQRVSLMRALLLDPPILLMDEPLGALDPMIRADLQDELRDVVEALEKTVLMVTHDMDEAAFFGDRITLMRGGGIVQRGELEELVRDPRDEFARRFIRAQRSELAARLAEWGDADPGGTT